MENSRNTYNIENAKKAAANRAVRENVKQNMVVGIGSGSTIVYVIESLKQFLSEKKFQIICIPTSYQSKQLILDSQLTLGSLDQYPKIDLTLDGADEVDAELNLIKGGGGCLVQEKIVASNSEQLVIIVDWRKISTRLGENWRKGVPVEIIPISLIPMIKKMTTFGGKAVLREGISKIGPAVTDNGNFIVDVDFGEIFEPRKLEVQLKSLTGVVDSGLFTDMVSKLYIGKKDNSVEKRG
ncbi:MAG: ribose 5-phosphate isomerase A [Candidatus Hodarchaeales archaeon]|jgi:ribose 5-phosphate isomerase A